MSFNELVNVWKRRARDGFGVSPNFRSNGNVLLLPTEILVLICCSTLLKARDLVSIELVCSTFRQKEGSLSITEQAAMMKINDARVFEGMKLTTSLNFKGLLFYLRETPIPIFSCPTCHWKIGGFRCKGRRPPQLVRGWEPDNHEENNNNEENVNDIPPVPIPTGCGCYLVWSTTNNVLFCPLGCGILLAPACVCLAYNTTSGEDKKKAFSEMIIASPLKGGKRVLTAKILERTHQNAEEDDHYYENDVKKKTPSMTCICCGYTVDEFVCLGKKDNPEHPALETPRSFRQAGFYERVWCSYRWSCTMNCSVFRDGPDEHKDRERSYNSIERALLCCVSNSECVAMKDLPYGKKGTEMATLEWIDFLGPATNYFSYHPTKLKTQENI